jgi:hypothetical protein
MVVWVPLCDLAVGFRIAVPILYAATTTGTLGLYYFALGFTDGRHRFSQLPGVPDWFASAAARVEDYLEGSALRLFLHRQIPPCASGLLGLFAAYLPAIRPSTFVSIVLIGDLLWVPGYATAAELWLHFFSGQNASMPVGGGAFGAG